MKRMTVLLVACVWMFLTPYAPNAQVVDYHSETVQQYEESFDFLNTYLSEKKFAYAVGSNVEDAVSNIQRHVYGVSAAFTTVARHFDLLFISGRLNFGDHKWASQEGWAQNHLFRVRVKIGYMRRHMSHLLEVRGGKKFEGFETMTGKRSMIDTETYESMVMFEVFRPVIYHLAALERALVALEFAIAEREGKRLTSLEKLRFQPMFKSLDSVLNTTESNVRAIRVFMNSL